MKTSPDTSWIRQHAEAAVVTGGAYGTVEFVPIERLTDTRIVLADGRRYQRTGYHYQVDTRRSGPDTYLCDPRDQNVVVAYARHLYQKVLVEADRPTRASADPHITKMSAEQVREALLRIQDQVNAAVRELDRRASAAEAAQSAKEGS